MEHSFVYNHASFQTSPGNPVKKGCDLSIWLNSLGRFALVGVSTTLTAAILSDARVASAQVLHFSIVRSFAGTGATRPLAPLLLAADGNFYGTTPSGGSTDQGTVFKMTPAGEVTILHSFSGAAINPDTSLIQAGDGAFYGSALDTLYRVTADGAFTILHVLERPTEGGAANALMQATDGNLYGTTRPRSRSIASSRRTAATPSTARTTGSITARTASSRPKRIRPWTTPHPRPRPICQAALPRRHPGRRNRECDGRSTRS